MELKPTAAIPAESVSVLRVSQLGHTFGFGGGHDGSKEARMVVPTVEIQGRRVEIGAVMPIYFGGNHTVECMNGTHFRYCDAIIRDGKVVEQASVKNVGTCDSWIGGCPARRAAAVLKYGEEVRS